MDWIKSRAVPTGLDSKDGRFRIVDLPGCVILFDFERDDDDGQIWRRKFTSVEEARTFAASQEPVAREES